ncbi:hypothetical protein L6452_14108 [Arctium lappa]|uniref:Uncharacterized protein n=1 Tax=Arctium lappa TaxID=4217 RepID=A0ACB9CK14_ARCLA|nr:hypothetical protein L6452_14108 [Arctium lappa]
MYIATNKQQRILVLSIQLLFMRSSFPFTFPSHAYFKTILQQIRQIKHRNRPFLNWVSEIIIFLRFNYRISVSTSLQSGISNKSGGPE